MPPNRIADALPSAIENLLVGSHLLVTFDSDFARGRRAWVLVSEADRQEVRESAVSLLDRVPEDPLDLEEVFSTSRLPKLDPKYTPADIQTIVGPPSNRRATDYEMVCYVLLGRAMEDVEDVEVEAALLKKIEHLEDEIVGLHAYIETLSETYHEKRDEVERLNDQLDAVLVLLRAQKCSSAVDRGVVASIANTVLLLVNSAVMAIGLSRPLPEPVEDFREAAIEVHVACVQTIDNEQRSQTDSFD